jgi:hypothetical protein
MKVYHYEVRHIVDGNLERMGCTAEFQDAVKQILLAGVKAEQVYQPIDTRTLQSFGVGETHDKIPVVFKIIQMEVK